MQKQTITTDQLDVAKCRELVKNAMTQPEPQKAFDFDAHIKRLKARGRKLRKVTNF